MNKPPQLGRPKDEELTEKILNATYQLLSQHPYRDISLVNVARVAGVSRKALYSRWQNKIALVIDSFQFFAPPSSPPDAATVRQSLILFLARTMAVANAHLILFSDLLAEVHANADTLAFFDTAFTEPRQQVYRALLEKGIAAGEFSPHMNVPLVSECLSAILRQRIMQRKPIDTDFIEAIVDLLLHRSAQSGH